VLLRSTPRMTQISDLLRANQAYAAARSNVADPRPGRRLAIVTCMDARIDVFAVLGLHLGEAHVIRNAGGRVTEDVLRSLALSSGVLGVETAVVMQHTKCGLVGVSDAQLREMTGADLGFLPIDDHAAALHEDVNLLAGTPYLSGLRQIAGLVYDVETGQLDDVVLPWPNPHQGERGPRQPLRSVADQRRDVQFSDLFDQFNARAAGTPTR
jgi:carbonic anhydrase